MRILGYIPARSGSKGVPDKNINLLNRRPLLHYTLHTALKCTEVRILDDIVVSSDSESYYDVCKELGYVTTYRRPPSLATDKSPTIDGILHVLDWYEIQFQKTFDAVMILQPTSPFRTLEHIKAAIHMMVKDSTASCVASVMKLEDHHPLRIKKIQDGYLQHFKHNLVEPEPSRRQDFQPAAYIRNGAIYLTKIDTIRKEKRIRGDNVLPLIMPDANSINIDTHFDFVTAEAALKYFPYAEYLSNFGDLK